MLTPEIMLLGGPNSGKTHLAGQLYGRLQRNPGALQLRKDEGVPADLSPLQEVLNCLEDGKAAPHTSHSTWAEVRLPLIDRGGNAVDLRWPDYGGEQLSQVFSTRSVNPDWQKQLCASGGWILLLRLGAEVTYEDGFKRLAKPELESHQGQADRAEKWDANAYWVEKLQILLHVAQRGVVNPISSPRLAILLSCYDELGSKSIKPVEVLSEKLPLVSSFVRNNWLPDAVSVWGLSALGKPLNESNNSDTFIDEGPEYQGWVVPPDGSDKDTDLTLPINWLLS